MSPSDEIVEDWLQKQLDDLDNDSLATLAAINLQATTPFTGASARLDEEASRPHGVSNAVERASAVALSTSRASTPPPVSCSKSGHSLDTLGSGWNVGLAESGGAQNYQVDNDESDETYEDDEEDCEYETDDEFEIDVMSVDANDIFDCGTSISLSAVADDFLKFVDLPAEIQGMVWQRSLPGHRKLLFYGKYITTRRDWLSHTRVAADNYHRSTIHPLPVPSLLHTCRASRRIAQKYYTLCFEHNNCGRRLYVDLERDVINFRDYEAFMSFHGVKIVKCTRDDFQLCLEAIKEIFPWELKVKHLGIGSLRDCDGYELSRCVKILDRYQSLRRLDIFDEDDVAEVKALLVETMEDHKKRKTDDASGPLPWWPVQTLDTTQDRVIPEVVEVEPRLFRSSSPTVQ